MSNIRTVGGLAILGVGLYLLYKVYSAGYVKGQEDTTRKYEQRISAIKIQHEYKINEMQTLIDQLRKDIANLEQKPKKV